MAQTIMPSAARRTAHIAALAGLYAVMGDICLRFMASDHVPVIWLPDGVALAAVLVWGSRVWPGIWLGSFLVNNWFFLNATASLSPAAIAVSGLIGAGSTLQALLGAFLIRRITGTSVPIERAASILQFVAIEALVCLTAPSIGVTSMAMAGFARWEEYGNFWMMWWLGDLFAIVTITPLVLAFCRRHEQTLGLSHVGELLLLFGLLLGASFVIYGGHVSSEVSHELTEFLIIPSIIWAALRFLLRGVTAFTFVVSGMSVWGTVQREGPFAVGALSDSLMLMQAFTSVVAVAGLVLAATIVERRRAEAALQEREKRFRSLIEKSSDAIALIDDHGTVLYVSPSTTDMLGYRVDELVGRDGFDVIHPEDQPRLRRLLAMLLQQPGSATRAEYRVRHKDGAWRWKEGVATNLLNEPGVRALVINYRDISERRESEGAIRRYAERLKILHEIDRAILEAQSSAGVAQAALLHVKQLIPCHCACIVLFDFKAHEATMLAVETSAVSPIQAGARLPLESFEFGGLESFGRGRVQIMDDMQASPRLSPVMECMMRCENQRALLNAPLISQGMLIGSLTLSSAAPAAFTAEHAEIAREVADLLSVAIQQTRLYEQVQQHAQKLEFQAMCDPLTGLPNRVLLFDRLQQAIQAGQRYNQSAALFIFDLDRFKEINDTMGHQYGDLLLKEIGPRLRSMLREADTLARLGGDEFGVLLPNTDIDGAIIAARKMLQIFDLPFFAGGRRIEIKASIGIALYPDHGAADDVLMRHADEAMYQAKHSRQGYAVYTPERDVHSLEHLTQAEELRAAMEENQWTLLYQPVLEIHDGRVVGVEALARWQHPRRGLLLPGQFFPLAEQSGLIKPMTLQLLGAVMRQCVAWQRQGFRLPVSMNLPGQALLDMQLPDQIASLLQSTGAAPIWLELEITERAMTKDPERALDVLARLHRMGIPLSLDDFGVGTSALWSLRRFPVQTAKLDHSVVSGMMTDKADAVVVRSVIDLAHSLGLRVIAEGVESQVVWNQLAAFECDAAQGFYISRPLPVEEFAQWLSGAPFRQIA
ncbi:MAG: EAL domain-containing protein [Nitrospirota bacterium]